LRLFLADEEWTPTELASVLPVEVSAISRLVTKLVDRGLIYRRRPRRDRRVVLLKLTEEGSAISLEIHRKVHAYEDSLIQGIPEGEIENLLSTIRKVMDNYNDMTE
ncbi:MAG: MarR family transcriptional regulator, partial [Chloroflexi bacterium]|nr:MarR family transcriptional regulator [Chloroflexota bacterium]